MSNYTRILITFFAALTVLLPMGSAIADPTFREDVADSYVTCPDGTVVQMGEAGTYDCPQEIVPEAAPVPEPQIVISEAEPVPAPVIQYAPVLATPTTEQAAPVESTPLPTVEVKPFVFDFDLVLAFLRNGPLGVFFL